jgi:hypothetical protein
MFVLTRVSGRFADAEIPTEATKTLANNPIAVDFDHIAI